MADPTSKTFSRAESSARNPEPHGPTLLDVNVLVALFDPNHVHHEAAHAWFGPNRSRGWVTCPLTENAVVRILSNPVYGPAHEPPGHIVGRLNTFCEGGDHTFWSDDISLCNAALFSAPLPVSHRKITDVYLLGLARHHGGCLATFDRSIPLTAVVGARLEHLLVIPA